MSPLEQIQLLIEELGPATDEVMEVQQEGESAWTVFFDEETGIGLDFIEDQNKLVFSMDLGILPEERKASSYEFILIYNFNWVQSGGIKMGLDASEGNIVMMFELNASSLDLQMLQNILLSFIEKGKSWRELIAVGFGGNTERDAQIEDLRGAIRI